MKSKQWIGAVLLAMVAGVVPLVVSACYYRIGLKEFPWFADSDATYDFFLYWKGQTLILLCGLLALYVAVRQMAGKERGWQKRIEGKYAIPLILYFLLSLLSAVLSEHGDMAIWGGYEQWEGVIIITAYVVVLFFAIFLLEGRTQIRVFLCVFLSCVFVMAVISVFQYCGHDFFRTGAGQAVMNFMIKKKLKFTFNFEIGRVYATLYNPNYVGSYVALVLPVVLSVISRGGRMSGMRNQFAIVTAAGLLLMLIGSESVTGCIGVASSLLLAFAFVLADPGVSREKVAVGAGVCVLAAAVVVCVNRPIFTYGLNKIFHPTPNRFAVRGMESREGALAVTTAGGDVLKLTCDQGDGRCHFTAADGGGAAVEVYEEGELVKFGDARFEEIQLRPGQVDIDGEKTDAFIVETPSFGKSYTVIPSVETYTGPGLSQRVFYIKNPFGKKDKLRHIESVGFEQNQHFGSRRGYIWSRTFPLLKDHMLIGSGPNTFVFEFPNDDYIGMKNVGYDGSVVTKPHNMLMQIWVQTGFLSLLAFLALYVFYFAASMKLYFRKTGYRRGELLGIGILLGTFGYLVTGLANDSTVAVAPVYWCLLGAGIAVNRYNKLTGGIADDERERTVDSH